MGVAYSPWEHVSFFLRLQPCESLWYCALIEIS